MWLIRDSVTVFAVTHVVTCQDQALEIACGSGKHIMCQCISNLWAVPLSEHLVGNTVGSPEWQVSVESETIGHEVLELSRAVGQPKGRGVLPVRSPFRLGF
jgi:hypothetical protein